MKANLEMFMSPFNVIAFYFLDLQQIKLSSDLRTHFWRYQTNKPSCYLATIEAIFYFFKDFETYLMDSTVEHRFDNLLFYFKYMYNKIRKTMSESKRLLPKAYRQT